MQKFFERVPTKLAERILQKQRRRIQAIVLYGSVARQEAQWSSDVDQRSDIDILVVTDQPAAVREDVLAIQVNLDLEWETVTNIVYRTLGQVKEHYRAGDPFIASVLREGVILYDKGDFGRLRRRLLGEGAPVPR